MATKDLNAALEIAASLKIPVAEAYRDSVIVNYERLQQQAALVLAAPIPQSIDGPMEFEP